VNDSKATNIHAALAGLQSVDEPLVVIAGGYDKGLNTQPLIELLTKRAKHVCLIGQTGPQLADLLEQRGVSISRSEVLSQAIQDARNIVSEGELVILSPGTSSFDQFRSFEDRGNTFERLVHTLT
jgi:UDP-N-acetylmuramoylalanine--D-glutamate ligase